ncbi:Helix-turn-helix, partial [Lachnospiraceae bacterium]
MFTVEEMDQIRKTYGIPYEEIQKGCGDVSISSIQKIFGGYVDRPRKATLEKLSKYFEMFLKENMSGKDDFKHLYERTVRDEYVAESNKFFSRGSSALDNPSGSYGEIFTQGGYTYEDYEKLQLPEGVRVEVIDGYIYTM